MSVKIYHNPRCSKSRQTLALLEEKGIKPEIVEYLKTPPSREELSDILKLLGMAPRELMRRKEAPYKEQGLDDPAKSDAALIAAMHATSCGLGLKRNPPSEGSGWNIGRYWLTVILISSRKTLTFSMRMVSWPFAPAGIWGTRRGRASKA